VRSQATVADVSYMRAMIPHHSIAIMTSRRAHLSDPPCVNWPTASPARRCRRSRR
jgi:hypothetical protein